MENRNVRGATMALEMSYFHSKLVAYQFVFGNHSPPLVKKLKAMMERKEER